MIESLSKLIEKSKFEGMIVEVRIFSTCCITHLLFVDSVLLFGKGSLLESPSFKEILCLFCEASSMDKCREVCLWKISWRIPSNPKSQIFDLHPYEICSLDVGFKYLGYLLKTNHYSKEYWSWLLKKVEKKLGNLSYRWLFLGGRLILIKSILKSILVYWLSLDWVPKSILNKLREIYFSFLLLGNKKDCFHLVK